VPSDPHRPRRPRGSGRAPAAVDPRVGARVEAFVKGAELSPVAEILARRRDEIVRRWLEAARTQAFHAAHPDGAVADHIPDLLDALTAYLRRSAPRELDPGAPLQDAAVREAAEAHAHDRFRQGLQPADVLAEFRLLRQEIGRALRESSDGASDMLAAELLVHDALDGATTLGLAALRAHEAEHRRVVNELAAIVTSSSDAIIGTDLESTITSWNPGAERLYGYTAQEAVGHSMALIIPPDRAGELDEFQARVRRGERVEPYLTVRQRKDGSRVEVSVTIAPLRDAAGSVVGGSAIARDVTQYRRAEEALRLHAELIQQAHEAVFAWHPVEGIRLWNRGAEELYGYTAQEALGRSSHALLHTPPEQVAEFTAALERDGRWVGELTHTTRDGRRLAVDARVALVRDDGRRYIVEATRDLTARRAAEDRLALLAEAGPVLAASLEYEATLANIARLIVPRLADWCAVDVVRSGGVPERLIVVHTDPARERLAQELRQRYPPDPHLSEGVPRVLRTGEPELVAEISDDLLRHSAHNAEHLALLEQLGLRSYMIVPLRARGQSLGAISLVAAQSGRRYGTDDLRTAQDLADRAALAIDNARLHREAQEEVRLREQLLEVVAHDLRNPVTAIKANADLLARQASAGRLETPRLVDRLNSISTTAVRMSAQIGELLDATRLRAGQPLVLDRQPTDLVALVRRVAAQVQQTTTQHTICVAAAVPHLVGEWDASRLERVFGNLLGNAVKYTPQGGEIRLEVDRSGQAEACAAVIDQGIGIPEAEQANIFERYRRASNVLGRFPGEGIGLAGVRQVVEQHGGTISVISRQGEGSTFSVRLPLTPPD
jgi:PAS domain S-box-containing protein